jgi:hypothetical protein
MKMNFTCEHFDWDNFTGKQKEPISKINFETKNNSLEDILGDFEMFLRGCGYYFEGHLGVVNEDEWAPMEDSCEECVCESEENVNGWNSVVSSLMNPPSFCAADLTGKNS